MDENTRRTRQSYDNVAQEYADRLFDELSQKSFDREALNRFAARMRGKGPVCDMGCGPGQITRYLHECGVETVFGIDLSPRMVELARELTPQIPFQTGNMLSLDVPDNAWAGITAFYSIIHIPHEQVVEALREMNRVLQPGGLLLLTFHIGEDSLHVEEFYDQPVDLDAFFFQTAEMENYLLQAGFELDVVVERQPYSEDVEYQSRRAYITARKPGI